MAILIAAKSALILYLLPLLALYTVFLYKATANLANIARQQESSTKTIERAWVKMSHTEDALIIWDNPTVRMCEITVMVENCGRTPASVTDVRLNICALEYGTTLPTTIDYGKPYPHGAPFLVPGDSFRWHKRTFSLGHLDAPNPVKGEIRLCLFGYVDYIDAFGKSHRAGYAREYLPIQGNNLVFISEPGYNYDRPRETNT